MSATRLAYPSFAISESNDNKEWWEDKALLNTVKRIGADMESGKDKGIAWSEAKNRRYAIGTILSATANKELEAVVDWYNERLDGLT